MAVTWIANSAKAYAGGQLTITKPAEVENDDLIVIVTAHDDASDHTDNWMPAGFTELADSPWLGTIPSDTDFGTAAAFKTASSEPSSWVFDATNTHNNEQQAAWAIILRGANNSDPVDTTAQVYIARFDDKLSPSVTVSTDGSFVICFGSQGWHSFAERFEDAAGYPDLPASLNNHFLTDHETDPYISIVGASGEFDSGATGTLLFGTDAGTSNEVGMVTIAISPTGEAAPRRIMVVA